MTIPKLICFLLFFATLMTACAVREIPLPPTPTLAASPTAADTFTPAPSPTLTPTLTPTPTPVLVIERGELPPGFSLTVYAEVTQPTSLTFGPDGKLYVASAGDQRVYSFADRDGDHRATLSNTFASGLDTPLGLLWIGNTLYISYKANVVAMQDTNGDGVEDQFKIVVPNLPTGLHQNDGMVLGADGYIYMGLGSTCDVCIEDNRLSGSILRFKPDGSDLSVYASGFRNPYDVAFNAAGDLFATDNGRDALGDDIPLEELNFIRPGLNYGWPDCWDGDADPECIHQTLAAATFTAHSSVDGLTFYNGDNFPPEYRDNAFVAVLGSYILPNIERGVKRVILHKGNGADRPYTGESEWFLKLDNKSSRPRSHRRPGRRPVRRRLCPGFDLSDCLWCAVIGLHRFHQLNAIAKRVKNMRPSITVQGRLAFINFDVLFTAIRQKTVKFIDPQSRVGFARRVEVCFHTQVNKNNPRLKPCAAALCQRRRFGNFIHPQHIAIKRARFGFLPGRHGNLNMVKS